jgi:hypothetical protein
MEKRIVPVRPYMLKQLAAIYQVDYRTLKNWMKPHLEEIGEKIGYYYQSHQVKIIFTRVPLPDHIILDEAA